MSKNYWCYRIDKSNIEFFKDELFNEGRLRQGWGRKQDLRNLQLDEGAGRNKSMFNKVKKNDILLVPQLPDLGKVAIVEATEDWSKGYDFRVEENLKDFGHIFPAKFLKSFTRNSKEVTGNLRSTLRNPSRFWNINHYTEDVENLINSNQNELDKKQDYESRLLSTIGSVFNESFIEKDFKNDLYDKLNDQFTSEEWEFILVNGLRKIFPFYQIERVGGKEEKKHGTDILIKMPSLISSYEYGISIQVKDYEGVVGEEVIQQINKADEYWNNENFKLIEKWVIVTRTSKEENNGLVSNTSNVKFIFANGLKELLNTMAKSFIGIN